MQAFDVIIFCNQPNLKGDPNNSWVFEDLGGFSYADLVVSRWTKHSDVKKIFLLVDTPQLYDCMSRFQSEKVHVKKMSHESYQSQGLFSAALYNFEFIREECIASWINEVSLLVQEDIFFVDSLVRGHADFNELARVIKRLVENPGSSYSLVGRMGYEGFLLDRNFLSSCVSAEDYDGLGLRHPDSLNYSFLLDYQNPQNNRSLIVKPELEWNLNSRKRLSFFKMYLSEQMAFDCEDFAEGLSDYFNKHSELLKSLDLKQIELSCVDQAGFIQQSVIDRLIELSRSYGRLTFVLRNLDDHPEGPMIAKSLKEAGLHVYVSLNAENDTDYYNQLYDYVDVVNFNLWAHNPELLKRRFPAKDARKIFTNFIQALIVSDRFKKMAVGVTYRMPKDPAEIIQAIIFFRERISDNPFFSIPGTRAGKQGPYIQFIRFEDSVISDGDMSKTLTSHSIGVDSQGRYTRADDCFHMNFEQYLRKNGYDVLGARG